MIVDLLAFLKPKVLFETETQYNGIVRVVSILGQKKLSTDGVTQSSHHKSSLAKNGYWRKAADIINSKCPNAKNVLFLGLGGGTSIHYILEENPKANLFAVEIDNVIIDVCKKYFELDMIPNLKVINADAFDLLGSPSAYDINAKFDVVFADMFRGGFFVKIPDINLFLRQIKDISEKGALVIFNYTFKKDDTNGPEIFMPKLKEVFGNVQSEILHGAVETNNYLIYSFNN